MHHIVNRRLVFTSIVFIISYLLPSASHAQVEVTTNAPVAVCEGAVNVLLEFSPVDGASTNLYDWSLGGAPITNGTNVSSITLASAVTSNAGVYSIVITNLAGGAAVTVTHTLVVDTAPALTATPGMEVCTNSVATPMGQALTNLFGATAPIVSTMSTPGVNACGIPTNAVTVVISNTCGSLTGDVVLVSSLAPPPITNSLRSVTNFGCVTAMPLADITQFVATNECPINVSASGPSNMLAGCTSQVEYTYTIRHAAPSCSTGQTQFVQTVMFVLEEPLDFANATAGAVLPVSRGSACTNEQALINLDNLAGYLGFNLASSNLTIVSTNMIDLGCGSHSGVVEVLASSCRSLACGSSLVHTVSVTWTEDIGAPVLVAMPAASIHHGCTNAAPALPTNAVSLFMIASNLCGFAVDVTDSPEAVAGCMRTFERTFEIYYTNVCTTTRTAFVQTNMYSPDLSLEFTACTNGMATVPLGCTETIDPLTVDYVNLLGLQNHLGTTTVSVTSSSLDPTNLFFVVEVSASNCCNTAVCTARLEGALNDFLPEFISFTNAVATNFQCTAFDNAALTAVVGAASNLRDPDLGAAPSSVAIQTVVVLGPGDACQQVYTNIYTLTDDCGSMQVFTQVVTAVLDLAGLMPATAAVPLVVSESGYCFTSASNAALVVSSSNMLTQSSSGDTCDVWSVTVTPGDNGGSVCVAPYLIYSNVYELSTPCAGTFLALTQVVTVTATNLPLVTQTPTNEAFVCGTFTAADNAVRAALAFAAISIVTNDACDVVTKVMGPTSANLVDPCNPVFTNLFTVANLCGLNQTYTQVVSATAAPLVVTAWPTNRIEEGCFSFDAASNAMIVADSLRQIVSSSADGCSPLMTNVLSSTSGVSACSDLIFTNTYTVFNDCFTTSLIQVVVFTSGAPSLASPPALATEAISTNSVCFDAASNALIVAETVASFGMTNNPDACSIAMVQVVTDLVAGDVCVIGGEPRFTNTYWLVNDCVSNLILQQTVVVAPEAPIFVGLPPVAVTIACDTNAGLVAVDRAAIDILNLPLCDSYTTTVVTADNSGTICGPNFLEYTNVYSVSNSCRVLASFTQVVTVAASVRDSFTSFDAETNIVQACVTYDVASNAAFITSITNALSVTNVSACLDGTISVVTSAVGDVCAGGLTFTNIFVVSDACGTNDTVTQVIFVINAQAPIQPTSLVGSITNDVNFDNTSLISNALANTMFVDPDPCDVATPSVISTTNDPGCVDGLYRVFTNVYTLTDLCGNTSIPQTQVFEIVLAIAPVITNLPASAFTFTTNCVSYDNAAQVTLASNAFLGGTALFDGDPGDTNFVSVTSVNNGGNECDAPYLIFSNRYTISDLCGNAVEHFQVVTVAHTNPPVFARAPDLDILTNECPRVWDNQVYIDALLADTGRFFITDADVDACEDLSTNVLSSTGHLSDCQIVYTNTYTVMDRCGLSTTLVQVITVVDPSPPVLVDPTITNVVMLECTELLPSTNAMLLDYANACAVTQTPVYVSQVVSGSCASGGIVVQYLWTSTNTCSATLTFTQTFVIVDTMAPVIGVIPTRSIACSDDLPAPAFDQAWASDNCNALSLFVSLDSQSTVGTGCPGDPLIRVDVFRVSDFCGNSSLATQFIIAVEQIESAFAFFSNQTVACMAALPALDDVRASFSNTLACSWSTAMVASVTNGVSSNACVSNVTVDYIYSYVTGCGSNGIYTQTFSFSDTEAPVFVDCPGDAVVECGTLPAVAPIVLAIDDCLGVVTATLVEVLGSNILPCASNNLVRYVYEATDLCGNVATCTQTLRVIDTEIPVIDPASVPDVLNGSCGAIPAADLDAVVAMDNCSRLSDGSLGVFLLSSNQNPVCVGGSHLLSYVYVAIDSCGNQSVPVTQAIHLVDSTPPLITALPNLGPLSCDATLPPPNPAALVVVDDCSDLAPILVQVVSTNFSSGFQSPCAVNRQVTYSYEAVDACGNVSPLANQVIAFESAPVPTIAVSMALISETNSCPFVIQDYRGLASVENVCGAVVITQTPAPGTILNAAGTFPVQLSVMSECGGSDQASFTLQLDCEAFVPPVSPQFRFDKSVTPLGGTCPGSQILPLTATQMVSYCFVIENTGSAALGNLVLDDPLLGISSNLALSVLATGAVHTIQVDAAVTASLTNTATFSAQVLDASGAPTGTVRMAENSAQVLVNSNLASLASIRLIKTISTAGSCPGLNSVAVAPGTPITYCFDIQNTGSTVLNNLLLTDPLLGVSSNLPGMLAPAQSLTVSMPSTAVTSLLNTATVVGEIQTSARAPGPPQTVSSTDVASLVVQTVVNPGAPAILLVQSVSATGTCPGAPQVTVDVGTPVLFCITVQNSGAVPLENLSITAADINLATNLSGLVLAPSATTSISVPHVAAAALTNLATVTATSQSPSPVSVSSQNGAALLINAQGALGSLAGSVWVDLNADGSPDNENLSSPDIGLNGLLIEVLLLSNGVEQVVATGSTSNLNGNLGSFLFTGLPAGAYRVRLTPNLISDITFASVTQDLTLGVGENRTRLLFPGSGVVTAVELEAFVVGADGRSLSWQVGHQVDHLGFVLYGGNHADRRDAVQLHSGLLLSDGSASYAYESAKVYDLYWLVAIDTALHQEWFGPYARPRAGVTPPADLSAAGIFLLHCENPKGNNVLADGHIVPALEVDAGLVVYLPAAARVSLQVSAVPTRIAMRAAVPDSALTPLLLQAEADQLAFVTPNVDGQYFLHGFKGVPLVLDVTSPSSPVLVVGDAIALDDEHAVYLKLPARRVLQARSFQR